jgi:hypothetical protein
MRTPYIRYGNTYIYLGVDADVLEYHLTSTGTEFIIEIVPILDGVIKCLVFTESIYIKYIYNT